MLVVYTYEAIRLANSFRLSGVGDIKDQSLKLIEIANTYARTTEYVHTYILYYSIQEKI